MGSYFLKVFSYSQPFALLVSLSQFLHKENLISVLSFLGYFLSRLFFNCWELEILSHPIPISS